jgi:uncharacterized protein (DUF1501 family)
MWNPDNELSRREIVKLSACGALGISLSGWLGFLAQHSARAAAPPGKRKSCILLWMGGGPSHIDTFDPKPGAPEEIRGALKSIRTSVTGIEVSERFPKIARLMKHGAILRGMSTNEADHGRAHVVMQTGYTPGAGGVSYPVLGSTVSAELGREDFPLPNYVLIGAKGKLSVPSAGYRGPRHQALILTRPTQGTENLKPAVPADDFDDRVGVLDQLEQGFARTHPANATAAHRSTMSRAVQLMRSDRSKAFDLDLEPAASKRRYGETPFGQSCVLARRLVEAGVPFVEVVSGNWDTHVKKAADDALGLMTQVDDGMSSLVTDLKDRGLLDSTLIIWMGEFGRTPKINRNGGRDHWARSWSTLLMGGAIKGGQVIGKTDAQGATVTDRAIGVKDFMSTVCRVLGIDYSRKIHTPSGRPIRIVESGEKPIVELF